MKSKEAKNEAYLLKIILIMRKKTKTNPRSSNLVIQRKRETEKVSLFRERKRKREEITR